MLYKYSNLINGSLEELSISEITLSAIDVRSTAYSVGELAMSIKRVGLLQPIIVRTNSSDNFEVVAGSRRLNACKSLGWRKIACHVVELDDKTAFEVSIIENVQRHSLNPIEEGIAFKKYVNKFGWGGISELAKKLSKSTSYICKRIKLTELPKDIVDLVSSEEINVSTVEELLPITGKLPQYKLTEMIYSRPLSSRMVRKIVREVVNKNIDKDWSNGFPNRDDHEIIQRLLVKAIIALRISIRKLAMIIENAEDKWILYEILMQVKHILHQQIDVLIREKRKYRKRSYLLATIS
jgi:ParB family transcriptional regulator, chromosome partitioning protein